MRGTSAVIAAIACAGALTAAVATPAAAGVARPRAAAAAAGQAGPASRPSAAAAGGPAAGPAGGMVTGQVTGAGGRPLGGVCVVALGRPGAAMTRTLPDGRYLLTGLAAGWHSLRYLDCSHPGHPASLAGSAAAAGRSVLIGGAGMTPVAPVSMIKVVLAQATRANARRIAGGSITGVVRLGSAAGQPLGGICVFAYPAGNPFSPLNFSASTGKTGHYSLSGMPTGRYSLSFSPGCNNNGNYVYLNLPKPVSVTAGKTTTNVNAYLQPGGIVTGIVTDSHGAALAGICVGVGFGSGAVTAKDGSYRVDQIPAGPGTASFNGGCGNPGSVAPQWWDNKADQAAATALPIVAGQTISGIDAAMQPGATVTGAVTSASGGKLSGVCVGVDTLADLTLLGGIAAGGNAVTSNGSYQVANLAPGAYGVEFFSGCTVGGPDVADQWYPGQPTLARAALVSLPAGAPVTGIDAVLAPGGSIRGTIKDTRGKPLTGICALATNRRTGFAEYARQLGSDGSYTVPGLPPGSYTVHFTANAFCFTIGNSQGYADQWYKGRGNPAQADPVQVTANKTTSPVSATMTTGGAMAGTVTDKATGKPLRGICVSAFDASSSGFGRTDSAGQFRIGGLDAGAYHVQFNPCGTGTSLLAARLLGSLVKVTAGRLTTGVTTSIGQAGLISGTVSSGSPAAAVPGMCVDAMPVGGGTSVEAFATTGPHGGYTLRNLAPGGYQVFLGDPNCFGGMPGLVPQWYNDHPTQATATVVHVTAGATSTGISADLARDGAIAGTVTGPGPAHQPLAGVCVTAASVAAGQNAVVAVSAADGSYQAAGLLPGQYTVEFQSGCGASGYQTQWWDDAATAAAATKVTVTAGSTRAGIGAAMQP